jgi:hypothetical protein
MDLEQFKSPNFNATAFLNQLLPLSNPDTYYTAATSLLPTLELLARNTQSELASALSNLLRNSNRLGIDMDTLTHDTRTLSAQVSRVETDVAGLQLEGGVMSELSLLEVVQERMQETSDAFVKAGQWNARTDEGIRFLIESGGFDVAEQRIGELRELVGIWDGTNEFKDRVERVIALERTLQAAKSPMTTPNATMSAAATSQRGTARPQSRLRVDSSQTMIRESSTGSGIFGQLRQNIGR